MTLTPGQLSALLRLKVGPVLCRLPRGSVGPDRGGGDLRSLGALVRRGLAEVRETFSGHHYYLTDAGREYLSQHPR